MLRVATEGRREGGRVRASKRNNRARTGAREGGRERQREKNERMSECDFL